MHNNVKSIGYNKALPFEQIPGPKPFPFIGNVWRFLPKIGDLHGIQPLDMQYK